MEISKLHAQFLTCRSVSTDTRKISSGCMFFALKGDRFDANAFAQEALRSGALFVVIDDPTYYVDDRTVLVPNVLIALQELAKFHREYLKLPIVGLTGSNGKTTTKELISAVLKKKYNVVATVGNLNNHIGVPLTLLSFTDKTEIGIVEMGANHQREITFLCDIARPDFGYITNFGKAHLEGFGGIEGVIKGKKELYDFLRENYKLAFVNIDDELQVANSSRIKSFTFGEGCSTCDLMIDTVSADPFVNVEFDGKTVVTKLIGAYNANNICAAIAIGRYFKVDDNDITGALEAYVPENNRSQLIFRGSNEIILDAYNANPSSMCEAIAAFSKLGRKRKVAILGDMFELGVDSSSEHLAIVDLAAKVDDAEFLFVGKQFYESQRVQNSSRFFETFEELRNYVESNQILDATILIKGSRGMSLERLLEVL